MIAATVITCPQRFLHYREFLRRFAAAGLGVRLRTFQTSECVHDAFANNNLNARAALTYGHRRLRAGDWLLYLEDDVWLGPELRVLLPTLCQVGQREGLVLWNLCNRKNPYTRQFAVGDVVVNEMTPAMLGGHGLLIPWSSLSVMLEAHWGLVSDVSMFAALASRGWKVWQVVNPVLVRHEGRVSTFTPRHLSEEMEVNHAG